MLWSSMNRCAPTWRRQRRSWPCVASGAAQRVRGVEGGERFLRLPARSVQRIQFPVCAIKREPLACSLANASAVSSSRPAPLPPPPCVRTLSPLPTVLAAATPHSSARRGKPAMLWPLALASSALVAAATRSRTSSSLQARARTSTRCSVARNLDARVQIRPASLQGR